MARGGKGGRRPNYGSGRRVARSGYVYVWRPGHPLAHADGYVPEHRLVLYEAGVDVPPGHHVHHRNGDRGDNRRENLAVLTARAHAHTHYPVGRLVRNQYGVFPVLAPEARLERERARGRANQARIRARRKAGAA